MVQYTVYGGIKAYHIRNIRKRALFSALFSLCNYDFSLKRLIRCYLDCGGGTVDIGCDDVYAGGYVAKVNRLAVGSGYR